MGVTILLTIYRRPDFYKEALNSLAKQTDQSFELIIYSNIPVEYDLSKFKDVKVIDSPNTTIASRYSDGLKKAKYDKIAFLDDDDVYSPDKIEFLNNNIFGYLKHDYWHITEGEHNPGKGFNMSSIVINRKYFSGLAEAFESNGDFGLLPDSFVYWYAIEHQVPIKIVKNKLSGYRFRSYSVLQDRMKETMETQLKWLNEASRYFKNQEVQKIIMQKIISNKIMLQSLGIKQDLSLFDIIWLMKSGIDGRVSKLLSYLLTEYLGNTGIKIINARRNKKIRDNSKIMIAKLSMENDGQNDD